MNTVITTMKATAAKMEQLGATLGKLVNDRAKSSATRLQADNGVKEALRIAAEFQRAIDVLEGRACVVTNSKGEQRVIKFTTMPGAIHDDAQHLDVYPTAKTGDVVASLQEEFSGAIEHATGSYKFTFDADTDPHDIDLHRFDTESPAAHLAATTENGE